MQLQTHLLAAAIVAVLAVSAPAMAAGAQSDHAARPDHSSATARALGMIDGHGQSFHRNSADRFVARDVIIDRDGTEHVRFDRTYRGLPVIGGDVVVHSRNGQLKRPSQTLKVSGRPDVNGRLNSSAAIIAAGAAFGSGFSGTPSANKVIYARGASPVLGYEVVLNGMRADQTPTEMHYIVDANSGRILDRWDGIMTGKPATTAKGKPGGGSGATCATSATGIGKTLTLGTVSINTSGCTDGSFQTKDLTRGGGYTTDLNNRTNGSGTIFSDADNTWGDNSLNDRATVGADAHYGVAETWDYYKNIQGRTGIDGNGTGALSRVHYGRNYVNAFWSDSCYCMTFGDGNGSTYLPLVAIDVAGHEMTHGVTSKTANLTYSGESGGLNESNSDIFGTMVEFYTNSAVDTPDYLIGESIYASNPSDSKALRWMYKPSLDGKSPDCYYSGVGTLDVHYSSAIGNHFYYLLAEGSGAKTFGPNTVTSPTCNGSTITGIGRTQAQKIWYRALTVYMTSSTNYAAARAATLSAASDLGYSTSAVAAAWSAVSVN